MMHNLFLLALLASVSSCSFAPEYHKPEMPVPTEFKEAKNWKQADPADIKPRGNWWEIYGVAELNDLETRAQTSNQDVKAAFARYEQARAQASFARADYFPVVTGNASGNRNRLSKKVAKSTPNTVYNDYSLSGDLSYELDLWGRVRNNAESFSAGAEASNADLAAAYLSLSAELATDYFALRADDSSQNILDDTVTAYQKALDLTRNRFKGGIASQTDVDQSELQLANAKTQAADMRMKRAQLEHAIAVLIGEIPSSFSLKPASLEAKVPSIGTDLPSALLERRPDVASAERRVAAANANVGVARAAWFPQINLLGSFGVESATTGNLFTAPSKFWAFGPSALLGFLDIGHISALNTGARGALEEAAANYRATALNAYREVEDSIVTMRQLEQENTTQTEATKAAERVLMQEQDRYTGGIVNYLNVVEAQNNELQAKLASVDIEARQLTASVQLIKTLGGGWNNGVNDKQKK